MGYETNAGVADLGAQPGAEADQVLLAQFERYRAGTLPPALWLELFEAAAKRDNAELKERLAEREREGRSEQVEFITGPFPW